MDQRYLVVVLLVLTLCILVSIHTGGDGFANKHDKADAIVAWFSRTPTPTYVDFRREVPNSNVVEYTDASRLMHQRNLTTDTLERIL